MAVFIELVTDSYSSIFSKEVSRLGSSRRAGLSAARRPLRGLEIKEDTYATMRVMRPNGEDIPLYDSGSETGTSTKYTNFLLRAVTEARMEKQQIVETFGEPYLYFFGEQPRFLDCQATLISSNDFNWANEFWENYEKYLRGTRCTEIGAKLYLFYDDVIVSGYMVMAQAVNNSQSPMEIQLNFRIFVSSYQNISLIGTSEVVPREGVDLQQSQGRQTQPGFYPQPNLYQRYFDNKDEWTGSVEDLIQSGNFDEVDLTGLNADHPLPTDQAVIDAIEQIIRAEQQGAQVDNTQSIDNNKSLEQLGVRDKPDLTDGAFGMLGPMPGVLPASDQVGV